MTATLEAPTEPEPASPPSSGPDGTDPPVTRHPVSPALAPWTDPNPRLGWLLALIVTAVAALTRLWAIGFPQGKSFDEVYYATEANEILRFGYEDNRDYTFIVHPPLGKLIIAAGEYLWDASDAGFNTIGYRLPSAIAGTLAVLLLARIGRRMFRSNALGAIAGLLLALDGVSLVQSRVALLDIFLQLFIVAAFGALVIDRDQVRGRLAGLVAEGADLSGGVPTLGPRPWRLAAGVLLGLANGVKWTALSFFVLFAIMSLIWDRGALKSAGVDHSWRNAMRRSWVPAIGSLLVAPIAAYLLTWLGWFAGENSWNRHWADNHSAHATLRILFLRIPWNWGFLPASIRSLGDYTYNAYVFHEGLDSFHPYRSNPWSWLILGRPVTYYYPSNPTGCGSSSCSREILLIGTPLMWWAFVPALLWLIWHWFTTRDWRAAVVWIAMAAGWLVWFHDLKRTMFLFYMTPLIPFLILGVTLALGTIMGPAVTSLRERLATGEDGAEWAEAQQAAWRADRRRRRGIAIVSVYLGLVIADFVWMWPLFTGGLLTYDQWHAHMWFSSWV